MHGHRRRAIIAGFTLISIVPLLAGRITVKVSLHPEVCANGILTQERGGPRVP